ncbi:MAG: GntR family transcriptional regulator, partial [Anaerovorax sp.]
QPVRELAIIFSVNPNTMQRALAELEREGILCTERTAGRFVTADEKTIESLRFQEANEALAEFKGKMKALGFSEEELLNFLKSDKREKVS